MLPGDFSFEEVRLQAYVEASQGRFQQQIAKEQQLSTKMNEERQKLLKNPYAFVQPPNNQGGGMNQGGPQTSPGAWGAGGNNNNNPPAGGAGWGAAGGNSSFTW